MIIMYRKLETLSQPISLNYPDTIIYSQNQLQEAFELRSRSQEDLLQIDAEIRQLKEKRAGVQTFIGTHTLILSPARRLLPDIL